MFGMRPKFDPLDPGYSESFQDYLDASEEIGFQKRKEDQLKRNPFPDYNPMTDIDKTIKAIAAEHRLTSLKRGRSQRPLQPQRAGRCRHRL